MRWFRALLLGMALAWPATMLHAAPPELLLANVYREEIDPAAYLVSEKLDGVRAVWDGQTLRTRAGNPIAAPAWFVHALPAVALDGELWMARGQFERVSGVVRKAEPIDAEWREVHYMIFELPGAAGTFADRAEAIRALVAAVDVPWLRTVAQQRVADRRQLHRMLDQVIAGGGEGLMLHRAAASYETGRSDTLLKLKPWQDAEAVVVAHLPGKGRHAGRLGALRVRLPDGREFNLGSGFTDAQRQQPPELGSMVTYRYRSLTVTGLPRFATFLRERRE